MRAGRLVAHAAVLACACTGGKPIARPPIAAENGATVTGTVVDPDGHAISGQRVSSLAASGTTDTDGRFVLPNVGPRYDIVIVSPDRAYVSIYANLTRRDPLLVHDVKREPSRPARHARIVGRLSGGGPFPLLDGSLHVHFSSARADADVLLGASTGVGGPELGLMTIDWEGGDTIQGELLALQMKVKGSDARGWGAHRSITLHDGETATVDLNLTEVPILHRPPAEMVVESDPWDALIVHESYRAPGSGWALHGVGPIVAGQPYKSPDLSAFGLIECKAASIWNPYLRSNDLRCGDPPDQKVVLTLHAPPAFSTPSWGTDASPGLKFAWSQVDGAVYRLELRRHVDPPSAQYPCIRIITTGTTAAWPVLDAQGVGFPVPLAWYAATISALGPYHGMDDATGPQGLGATVPPQRWSALSQELGIPVMPAMRPDVAACQYPLGKALDCGPIPNSLVPRREIYGIGSMNELIRSFPELADAIGIHCVRDCDDARAFAKAYAEYAKKHPDFDAKLPIPPTGSSPPPPFPPMPRRSPGAP